MEKLQVAFVSRLLGLSRQRMALVVLAMINTRIRHQISFGKGYSLHSSFLAKTCDLDHSWPSLNVDSSGVVVGVPSILPFNFQHDESGVVASHKCLLRSGIIRQKMAIKNSSSSWLFTLCYLLDIEINSTLKMTDFWKSFYCLKISLGRIFFLKKTPPDTRLNASCLVLGATSR